MHRYTVHAIPGSPYVRAVLLTFEEKGEHGWRIDPLPMGGHRTPEHLARHPFGRVPALSHGEFVLYETQAILRYLDRVIDGPALVPDDPRAEARMNQVIGIVDSYVVPQISAPISFQRVVAPRFGLPVDEARLDAARPLAVRCVAELARLLGDHTFVAGAAPSLADLMLAPHLSFLPLFAEGQALLDPHPQLSAWVARMEARPSMQATTVERLFARIAAAS